MWNAGEAGAQAKEALSLPKAGGRQGRQVAGVGTRGGGRQRAKGTASKESQQAGAALGQRGRVRDENAAQNKQGIPLCIVDCIATLKLRTRRLGLMPTSTSLIPLT